MRNTYLSHELPFPAEEVFGHANLNEQFPKIKHAIALVTGVPFCEIAGRCRKRNVFYARTIFTRLCRLKGAPLKEIATETCHHHASIIYYLKKFDEDYRYNKDFVVLFGAVIEQLKSQNTSVEVQIPIL